MQRRKFLGLFGVGGIVAAAPVAAATVAIVKAGRDEVSAIIPPKPLPKPEKYPSLSLGSFEPHTWQIGEDKSYVQTKFAMDKKYDDQHLLQFKLDDVSMKSVKFVEIENGNYVMMFEKEKLNESTQGKTTT